MDPAAYASSRCDPLWQRVSPGRYVCSVRPAGRPLHPLNSRRLPMIERAALTDSSRLAALHLPKAYIDEHKRSLDEHHGHSLLQEWLEQRQSDNVSFGEEKLVQGPEQSRRLSSVLLHALQKITVAGLRLTGVLVHLVNRMTADIRRALWWQERTAKHRYLLRLAAENQKQQRQAELAQNRKVEQAGRRDAGDPQFLKMLHSMDDASIPLEAKWDAIAKQMGSKEEFRKQLSKLFELAGESSTVVQGLASSPDKFWKSAHTKSVIAQEEALKRHLFAQMFDAGATPA